MNDILLLFLEKICEAIYFSLFLIYGKNLKEKRMLFIGIMIFEYLMITKLIQYNTWIHISYIIMTYINLKVLYKEKAQITDIFLFMVASIILIIVSVITYLPAYIICNHNVTYFAYIVAILFNRLALISILYFGKNIINKIYKKFYTHWNKPKQSNNPKVKSLTLRNITIIIFNLMFYILNIGMCFALAIALSS